MYNLIKQNYIKKTETTVFQQFFYEIYFCDKMFAKYSIYLISIIYRLQKKRLKIDYTTIGK